VIKSVALDDDETSAVAESIPKRTYNAFLLRAVNEGLADFWGWVYTGDDSFIQLSLPREGGVRRLDMESGRLPDGRSIRASLVDFSQPDRIRTASQRVSLAYVLGTQYARFMHATALEIIGDKKATLADRKAVARAVLDILPSIGQQAADSYDREFMSPNFILKPLTLRLGKLSVDTCARLQLFKADDQSFDVPAACTKTPTGGEVR